jgi:hypothetical protein
MHSWFQNSVNECGHVVIQASQILSLGGSFPATEDPSLVHYGYPIN